MECYDKALTLNPCNCDAYVARGAARANQRQFEGALQDFRAALGFDPNNANAAKYLQVKICSWQLLATSVDHRMALAGTESSKHCLTCVTL
jgi:tetratricopeptide (TPR) repeat protein